MSFFERLKAEASAEWRAYTEHAFTAGLANGTLPEAAFRTYAEIATRLAARSGACAATNRYSVWINEYAGAAYQEVAAAARAHMDRLAARYATAAREAELITVFKEATRLEAEFWEMGWRAGRVSASRAHN
jgi:thiaminase/transcriptional activator TenA